MGVRLLVHRFHTAVCKRVRPTQAKSIREKYKKLSLIELGKLYQSGKNDELDETENDVTKGLINEQI